MLSLMMVCHSTSYDNGGCEKGHRLSQLLPGRPVGVGASGDRQNREQHNLWQSTQLALCPPRVFDFGQQVKQMD
jgi:hypothetical protein